MEAAAAAAVDGRGDEATRPAGGQPAEATEQPASPNAVEQAAAAEHKPGGAVTAAAARAGARAQGTSSGGSAPKRKPGRPALHQGCQVRRRGHNHGIGWGRAVLQHPPCPHCAVPPTSQLGLPPLAAMPRRYRAPIAAPWLPICCA